MERIWTLLILIHPILQATGEVQQEEIHSQMDA